MAPPLREDDLTRVAAFLAEQEAQKKGQPLPASVRRKVFARFPGGGTSTGSVEALSTDGAGGFSSSTTTTEQIPALREQGYEWAGLEDYNALKESVQPSRPPPGKLPFFSGTPTHEARPTQPSAPAVDPKVAGAMSLAATAARARGGTTQPAAVPPPPPSAPPPRKDGGMAGVKRSLEVRATSSGSQPALRPPQEPERPPPAELERRLAGLPEGVATTMRKRWGMEGDSLRDAQDLARRQALGVEIAAAGDQIASGFTRTKYNDANWDGLRKIAGSPVGEYQARATEARQGDEAERRAAEDERDAREAEAAARMELEKFEYGKGRDKSQEQLQRDRMAQEQALAEARLRADAADRGLRRSEIGMRATERTDAAAERARLAREQRQADVDARAQAQLAERAQPASEMKADIEYLNGMLKSGAGEFDAIPGVGPVAGWLPEVLRSTEGDKVAQAANRLAANIILAKSGKAATDAERKSLLASYGLQRGGSEEAWTVGMQALARDAAASLQNIEAGYSASVVGQRRERGGVTARDIPAPYAPPPVVMVAPDGQQYTVDGDEVEEATRNGWRKR